MTLDWQDGPVRVLVGDVRTRLAELADESVHCVVTSPPYWGLRDYGTGRWEGGEPACDHRGSTLSRTASSIASSGLNGSKKTIHASHVFGAVCGRCGARRADQQLGLESTPEEFVCAMVEVFREVRRVLRPDGTLWLNLGDSYAGDRGRTDDGMREVNGKTISRRRDNAPVPRSDMRVSGLKPKDLIGVPWRAALALQADGWWLRSEITWCKTAPMPESIRDRPTSATEKVFLLSRTGRYYYDPDAVREPDAGRDHRRHVLHRPEPSGGLLPPHKGIRRPEGRNGTGRNMRNYWVLGPEPYPAAHFAVFPSEIPRRAIAAGTSERGCCPECGTPWRRVVERTFQPQADVGVDRGVRGANGQKPMDESNGWAGWPRGTTAVATTGWQPDCTHEHEPIPCTVLDPFAGSGTTLAMARRMGRRALGIELQPDYLPLIQRRVDEAALPLLEMLSGGLA